MVKIKDTKGKKHSLIVLIGVPLVVAMLAGIAVYELEIFKPKPTAYDECVEDGGSTMVLTSNPPQYECVTKNGKTYIQNTDGEVYSP